MSKNKGNLVSVWMDDADLARLDALCERASSTRRVARSEIVRTLIRDAADAAEAAPKPNPANAW